MNNYKIKSMLGKVQFRISQKVQHFTIGVTSIADRLNHWALYISNDYGYFTYHKTFWQVLNGADVPF